MGFTYNGGEAGAVEINDSAFRIDPEVCRKHLRHQQDALSAAGRRFCEEMLASIPQRLRRRLGLREPRAIRATCSKCGTDL